MTSTGIGEPAAGAASKPRHALMETRNPLVALPSYAALLALDAASQAALRAVLGDLRHDANRRAEEAWRKSKAPVAAYWRAVSTYALHLRRDLCKRGTPGAAKTPTVHGPRAANGNDTLTERLAEMLARVIDAPLMTVDDAGSMRKVELRVGSFDAKLANEACALLEEAGH